jgi:hypothetical protein
MMNTVVTSAVSRFAVQASQMLHPQAGPGTITGHACVYKNVRT